MLLGMIVAGLIAASLAGGKYLISQPPSPPTNPLPAVSPTLTSNDAPLTGASPAPIASPSATPTPMPTSTPKPKPTLTSNDAPPTPTPTLNPAAADLYNLTDHYAAEYKVSADTLRHIARCESGFNPRSAHLDYAGLYQFSPGAWRTYRSQMQLDPNPDLRYDSIEAVRTAAYVLSINRQSIWPNCLP